VASLAELEPGSLMRCDLEGTAVCVARLASGEVLAVADTCTHEEASLSEGFLEGSAIECPWHSSIFDVRTGELLGPPATESIATFPVVVDGDEVWLEGAATAP
jgi:3-phenylpropionate/trans-cinnamate dioxygenase ferredoxin subunit